MAHKIQKYRYKKKHSALFRKRNNLGIIVVLNKMSFNYVTFYIRYVTFYNKIRSSLISYFIDEI